MAKPKTTKKTAQPKPNSRIVLSDPNERKRLKTALATITHYFQQIDDHKEGVKETIADIAATTGLNKKTVRKLATTMYKHNYASLQEENHHFEILYETVIEGKLTAVKGNPVVADDTDDEEQQEAA